MLLDRFTARYSNRGSADGSRRSGVNIFIIRDRAELACESQPIDKRPYLFVLYLHLDLRPGSSNRGSHGETVANRCSLFLAALVNSAYRDDSRKTIRPFGETNTRLSSDFKRRYKRETRYTAYSFSASDEIVKGKVNSFLEILSLELRRQTRYFIREKSKGTAARRLRRN